MKIEFSRQIFKQFSNIKFHENPFSGSRVVPSGRTDGRTDMKKLVVAFRKLCEKRQKIYSVLNQDYETLILNSYLHK